MKIPHPLALFRMSVLGSLISSSFHRGELKQEIARLANRSYAIPGSDRLQISPKTIERWYYTYQREGAGWSGAHASDRPGNIQATHLTTGGDCGC